MKKVFPFLAGALLLAISCMEQSTELTDEQKATIISEVEDQYSGIVSTLNDLDVNAWTEYWSEDDFISANSNVNFFHTRSEWVDSVTYWFSLRESQEVQIVEINTTALTADLTLLTSITNWDFLLNSGDRILHNGVLATLLWKKEESGWKIICLHESGHEDNEE